MSASENWTITMIELPGVIESGMSGRNGQRKPGTTRGSPRRSRTAKASRISRLAVKSRCACEWGGWGRLSDDGPGQHNPDPSEGPWGGGLPTLPGGALARNRPDPERDIRGYERDARRAEANQYGASACREQASAGRRVGKAPFEMPSFQPYWGKPAVRNDRGDRGDVGIIRSPVRASILPDPGLDRLDVAPHRIGAYRCVKAPIDGQDHVGLPREDLFRRDVDDRPRRGILARDVAGADKVDDLAADRTGDGRLETVRSAGDVNARPPRRRYLRRLFLNIGNQGFGVVGERLHALGNPEQGADSAQCRGGFDEPTADQREGNMGLLLHAIGERHIGRAGIADIEHQIGSQPHDVFEIDRIAASGKPPEFGEVGIPRG